MIEGKRDKGFYEQRASDEMARHFISADYDVRQKLALAGRMLAREDHESGLAGQITGRAERPGTFWTARFGYGLDEVTASNLLLVDDDLNPVEGDGMPNPSTRFHLWVYRARPEEAAVLAVFMERAARMQLRARAVGPIKPIRPELAREARQILRDQGDGAIK